MGVNANANAKAGMEGLEEMLGDGIKPTESTLTSIIKGCELAGDLASARAVYQRSDDGMSSAVIHVHFTVA